MWKHPAVCLVHGKHPKILASFVLSAKNAPPSVRTLFLFSWLCLWQPSNTGGKPELWALPVCSHDEVMVRPPLWQSAGCGKFSSKLGTEVDTRNGIVMKSSWKFILTPNLNGEKKNKNKNKNLFLWHNEKCTELGSQSWTPSLLWASISSSVKCKVQPEDDVSNTHASETITFKLQGCSLILVYRLVGVCISPLGLVWDLQTFQTEETLFYSLSLLKSPLGPLIFSISLCLENISGFCFSWY